MGKKLELTLAILNGAIGDYLERTDNGLATRMDLVREGRAIPIDRAALGTAYPAARPRAILLVHGLMCTEDVWELPDGSGDYGSLLAPELDATPLYLRYNSGLAIPSNGARLAGLLESLIDTYPAPLAEILPIGFSMGGLVVRSACHVAAERSNRWLSLVRRAIYVGTPHLGAPLERYGRVVTKLLRAIDDPTTRLIGEIADLRSAGVKDLGDADIRHEDRAKRKATVSIRDPRHPVPLLPSIKHYLVAGSLAVDPRLALLLGDSIVPVPSATDGACIDPDSVSFPPGHIKVLGGVAHMTLAHHPPVTEILRTFCEDES